MIGLVVFAVVNLVYALVVEAISSDAEAAEAMLAIVGLAAGVLGTTWLQGALFLLTIWAVIAPVIVIEHRSALDSFGGSRELVRGHGWTVFGIVVITGLLSGIASGLLHAAFSFLPRFLEILVGGTIAQAVVAPFVAIALAITYFRLREEAADRAPSTQLEP